MTRLMLALIAVAMIGTSLWSHAWAKARAGDHVVEVGLFSAIECGRYSCQDEELRKFGKIDRGDELEAAVCFYTGATAAAAIALAGLLLRRRRLPIAVRVALGAPLVASFGATVVFMEGLAREHWLDVSWAPFAVLGGALLGVAVLILPPDQG
jgi:hypothetical protein